MGRADKNKRISRRSFLKSAALAATAPAIIPSRIFSQTPPSDTILIGCIGVGRQGVSDMQEAIYRGLEVGARVVAVCDIDAHRLEDAQWLAEFLEEGENVLRNP